MTNAALLLASSLLLAGCAGVGGPRCPAGQQAAVSESLYFGTAKPVGVVSRADWAAFLSGVVTPRFPAGLTAWPAAGQWQSADGTITHENSFVLTLVHPADDGSERAVAAIVAEYKSRFQQEAVLRVKVHACTSL
jgi:hypothetical protein